MAFEKILADLSLALKKADIPYMIVGGQAVLVHGQPRLTNDIDVTLGLEPFEAERILDLLPSIGLVPLVDRVSEFLQETFVLPVQHQETGIRVDIIFSLSEYERDAIARAVPTQIGAANVRIATVEDVIIHKLVAARPRDLEDVRGLMAKNRNFDEQYVLKWLRAYDQELETDLEKTFHEIRREFPET